MPNLYQKWWQRILEEWREAWKDEEKKNQENKLLNTVELQNFIIQLLLLLKPLFKLDPYFSSELWVSA